MALFFVFSARRGIRTGKISPVLTAYFPLLADGISGKGGFVRGPITIRLPYWSNGLFYPSWNRLLGFTAYW